MSRSSLLVIALCLPASGLAQLPKDDDELLLDYSQWKLAGGSGSIADPVTIAAKPGFAVEVVRTADKGEGSWISLAFDPRGRLLVGREDKGILRMTLSADGKSVEKTESVNDTLLEPRGLLIAHDSLYVTANNMLGLYRLQDADGNDTYEKVELLQKLEGGVGHGRNGLALGPDGKIYIACGNNVKVPKDLDLKKSPYRNFGVDRLLPCAWNEFLFDSDVTPPAGFVLRCDKDGQNVQLVAGGFRNPYDLAFNRDGELFTYDADMEWDAGAPWYRPTTVIHVVPGGEYGWRQGTNVWPDHFPDALPRVVDVGLGSPTGVAFADKSRFPPPYRDALFILDWAYGRILAVHLTEKGASYSGKVETFLRGKPLNVTDVVFGPDGAMYFSVGGRGTRSAVYRVRWTGEVKPVVPVADRDAQEQRERRRKLEPFLVQPPKDSTLIQQALMNSDPFVRDTGRVALERHGSRHRGPLMFNVHSGTTMFMAIARTGSDEEALASLDSLGNVAADKNSNTRVAALRSIELVLCRHGLPKSHEAKALEKQLSVMFPAKDWPENQLLTELLVHLQSQKVISGSLFLLPRAENDQQRLFYLYALRLVKSGWTIDQRREYLKWLKDAEKYPGAHYLPRFLTYIRTDALATFTDEQREALKAEIDALGRYEGDSGATTTRPEVMKWKLDELFAAVGEIKRMPDKERGKQVYAEAQCVRCHRYGPSGVPFGPDLQHVSARYGTREVLEAIVEPSRVIDDKYRTLSLETGAGQTATGFLVGGDAKVFYVAADPLRPTTFSKIDRADIIKRTTSPQSPMPDALLNTFTANEVYDLLGYLGAIGQR